MTALEKIQTALRELQAELTYVVISDFVEKPEGKEQKSELSGFDVEWVDQRIGACDDTFGHLYLKVNEGVYVQFYFSS